MREKIGIIIFRISNHREIYHNIINLFVFSYCSIVICNITLLVKYLNASSSFVVQSKKRKPLTRTIIFDNKTFNRSINYN